MNLPSPEEIQPGVYQLGDDISLVAVTSQLILVGLSTKLSQMDHERILVYLKLNWPDKNARFIGFPTTGRSDFKAIKDVPELRQTISEIVSEAFQEVFDAVKGDGK